MTKLPILPLTGIAMLAFAGNSLLCRLALKSTGIEANSFTTIRLVSGALFLAALVAVRSGSWRPPGRWPAGLALWGYAIAFSFAYVSLTAATGALILFATVQVTMIGAGVARGERLNPHQWLGVTLALGGLVYLLLPGLAAPPLASAATMMVAGIAWGVYSLLGRGVSDPVAATAGNFRLAAVPALLAAAIGAPWLRVDAAGVLYAVLSGALASGAGYIAWYAVLPRISATQAAIVQLSVPVLAAIGGVALLGELPTWRLAIASVVVLAGIALVILRRSK